MHSDQLGHYSVPAAPKDRLPLEGETIMSRAAVADYKIDHETGCWVWQKFLLRGYPQGGKVKPHRLYYERAHGPIPADHDVHHHCRNRACVNPEHLAAVPGLVHRKAHRLAHAGVSFDDYREMRRRYWEEGASPSDLGAEYGVHRRSVWQAARGLKWAAELGPYTPPVRICALEGCEAEIGVERRNDAKFCTPYHQGLHHHRTSEKSKARSRENQRRRRAEAKKAA